ncbi:MAG: 4Fe-4S binding protein [Bacillota bacterium]
MFGKGLLKGLKVTGEHLVGKTITEQYPERKPNLPPRSHGFFLFEPEKCTSCGLCSMSCPNDVITVSSYRDKETKKRILTGYVMSLEYCLYCGLCVEACPSDCLHVDSKFDLSSYTRKGTEYVFYEKENEVQLQNE